MATVQSHRDLIVWQEAMDSVEAPSRASGAIARGETHGPKAQQRRSAISIPSRLAAGWGRDATRDLLKPPSFAHGSLMEAETQAIPSARSTRGGRPTRDGLLTRSAEVGRLLDGPCRSPRRRESDHPDLTTDH